MSLPTVFYCSPTKAQQLGYTITKTHILSTRDATKLKDEYKAKEAGKAWSVGVVLGILGIGIKNTVLAIGYVISSDAALTVATESLLKSAKL